CQLPANERSVGLSHRKLLQRRRCLFPPNRLQAPKGRSQTMNRFHVHLNVSDLDASIRFYSHLFGSEPSVAKHDYAKWMLDDPRINFAISNTGRTPGIDHLGLQVESTDELGVLGARLDAAGQSVLPENATTC